MKSTIYTIEDDSLGIVLTIEAEVCDFEDGDPPEIIIQEISHNEKSLSFWCLSDTYRDRLRDKIFQEWCFEGMKA